MALRLVHAYLYSVLVALVLFFGYIVRQFRRDFIQHG